MKYLLLGGPHDGDWVERDPEKESILLLGGSARQDVYTAQAFKEGDFVYIIYAHESIVLGQMFSQLLSGYGKPCKNPTVGQRDALSRMFLELMDRVRAGKPIDWVAMPYEVWKRIREAS